MEPKKKELTVVQIIAKAILSVFILLLVLEIIGIVVRLVAPSSELAQSIDVVLSRLLNLF